MANIPPGSSLPCRCPRRSWSGGREGDSRLCSATHIHDSCPIILILWILIASFYITNVTRTTSCLVSLASAYPITMKISPVSRGNCFDRRVSYFSRLFWAFGESGELKLTKETKVSFRFLTELFSNLAITIFGLSRNNKKNMY